MLLENQISRRKFTSFALMCSFGALGKVSASSDSIMAVRINNSTHRFRLLDNDESQSQYRVDDLAKKHDASLVINGGFYTPSFSPTGYLKIDGEVKAQFYNQSLSGLLHFDEHGTLSVSYREKPAETDYSVLQTGPFLIDPGAKRGIRTPDTRVAHRSFIVGHRNGDFSFAVARNTTLHRLQDELLALYNDIDWALNLDGGPVAGLWYQADKATRLVNRVASRNYIAVFKR